MPPDVVGEAAVTPRSVRSRIFDALVVESGAGLAVVAVVMVALDGAHLGVGQVFDIHTVRLWTILAVPLIVMMGYFPMLIGRTGGGIEIGLESCVLIFLANVSTPWEALLVWLLGTTIAQLLSDKRRATKAFNSGLGVIAGGLALLVISLTRADRPATIPDLLAMGLGAAVYFAVDFFLSAISLSLQEGTSLRQEVVPTGALEAFISFLAISSLGYLAALVVYAMSSHNLEHPLPLWSAVLLRCPRDDDPGRLEGLVPGRRARPSAQGAVRHSGSGAERQGTRPAPRCPAGRGWGSPARPPGDPARYRPWLARDRGTGARR